MSLEKDKTEEINTIPRITFNMENLSFLLQNPLAKEIFTNGSYGQWISDEEEELRLEPEEALLLLDRSRIEIQHSEQGEIISKGELVAHFSRGIPNFWSRYLV